MANEAAGVVALGGVYLSQHHEPGPNSTCI